MIHILATGGTIAGEADPTSGGSRYKAGVRPVGALLASVPGLAEAAEISAEQILALDSKDMTPADWLEDAAMEACLNDTANAEALIKQFQTNFEADGVEGTPTIFINGTKYSNMANEDLKPILDAELAK